MIKKNLLYMVVILFLQSRFPIYPQTADCANMPIDEMENALVNIGSEGSGFVFYINPEGTAYALTAYHCVEKLVNGNDAKPFDISFRKNNQKVTATMVTGESTDDYAVLKLSGYPLNLKPLSLKNASLVKNTNVVFLRRLSEVNRGFVSDIEGRYISLNNVKPVEGDSGSPIVECGTGLVIGFVIGNFEDETSPNVIIDINIIVQILMNHNEFKELFIPTDLIVLSANIGGSYLYIGNNSHWGGTLSIEASWPRCFWKFDVAFELAAGFVYWEDSKTYTTLPPLPPVEYLDKNHLLLGNAVLRLYFPRLWIIQFFVDVSVNFITCELEDIPRRSGFETFNIGGGVCLDFKTFKVLLFARFITFRIHQETRAFDLYGDTQIDFTDDYLYGFSAGFSLSFPFLRVGRK